jgi:hypothetical protein
MKPKAAEVFPVKRDSSRSELPLIAGPQLRVQLPGLVRFREVVWLVAVGTHGVA